MGIKLKDRFFNAITRKEARCGATNKVSNTVIGGNRRLRDVKDLYGSPKTQYSGVKPWTGKRGEPVTCFRTVRLTYRANKNKLSLVRKKGLPEVITFVVKYFQNGDKIEIEEEITH